MNGRLPNLTPAELSAEQRSIYEAITSGDRAKGPQHFPLTAADGSLHGPFGVMVHSPGLGGLLQELGAALRFRTDLSARCREIAILQVAQGTGSSFEWWAHSRVARGIGMTEEEIMSLSVGAFINDDPVERAVAALCANLLASSAVTEAEYESVKAVLTVEQMIDVTVLVGYYRTLAQLMAVFDIGLPEGQSPPLGSDRHHHSH